MKKFTSTLLCSLLILSSCKQSQSTPPQDLSSKSVKIATENDPNMMDPRRGRTLTFAGFMHLLYEGLMRPDLTGRLVPGAAESYEVSEDGLTYTFKLRDSHWSNGDPVTADDFVYAIKTSLSPDFPAPNAYQLYDIVGAKEAKSGEGRLEDIGIEAIDSHTLVIQLRQPVPYFLELTAFHAFFPVHSNWDKTHSNWADGPVEEVISNGPYRLIEWKHGHELTLEKNPHYWDAHHVAIPRLEWVVSHDHTALQLFEQGQMDWIGSPYSTIPPDALQSLKKEGKLSTATAAGTYWLRFQIEKTPLDNVNIRKALSYAINRKALVDHVTQGNQIPAESIVPPSISHSNLTYFKDHDVELAKELFQKGLDELHLTADHFPPLTLLYGPDERSHKIAQAIQQDWQRTFPVPLHTFLLEVNESKVVYQRLSKQDYQIAIGSWFADFRDPINFLEVFKTKNTATNNTLWGDPAYTELLNQSTLERDPIKRLAILEKAEGLLMDQMPVAPLFFSSYLYLKNDKLHKVYFSDLGYLDFKYASWNETSSKEPHESAHQN